MVTWTRGRGLHETTKQTEIGVPFPWSPYWNRFIYMLKMVPMLGVLVLKKNKKQFLI
jgi:hypothetical protein